MDLKLLNGIIIFSSFEADSVAGHEGHFRLHAEQGSIRKTNGFDRHTIRRKAISNNANEVFANFSAFAKGIREAECRLI